MPEPRPPLVIIILPTACEGASDAHSDIVAALIRALADSAPAATRRRVPVRPHDPRQQELQL